MPLPILLILPIAVGGFIVWLYFNNRNYRRQNRPAWGWDFGDYVAAQCKQRGVSRDTVADALQINRAYFGRVCAGKVMAMPDICQRVTVYFGDAPEMPLRAAGWLKPDSTETAAHFIAEFTEQLRTDSDLRRLYEHAQQLEKA